MVALTKQPLMYAENLTLPSVIVISANMGCSYCQDRVSQLLTKITGLKECTVDVSNRQVIVKGEVENRRIAHSDSYNPEKKKLNLVKLFIRFLRAAFICT